MTGLLALGVSALANASMIPRASTSTIHGDTVATESAAVDQARQMLAEMNSMSSLELSKAVTNGFSDGADARSFKVVKANASVDRIITETGFSYQPTVRVSYQYREIDRD
ncbi:acyl-CoA synthetase [Vibrio parahaemolyticus]|uniref:acyl-CoA synthetase n=1 Tax=Vibrio parahaemolyticus TaxID=670 RepID=UPI0023ECFD6D|nr:acyl-CoA synthetase [Vibrio parahaemolyticus]MDF4495532.1 acyl-CoA synthetase [Vibrio parahaemolyticus]MDG3375617.1 acyl-CoA synthetase [Vibrio parahaemolyticus]MDT8844387.1 acyl-CoA synthetase [Vibrio parahaemolyticus]MDT8916747.1 acyl-CoA synthetase [Vibrio parahaemolyticus]MEA5330743.1 acyl-CoA synthetase [Vibrio parahaemolyticus]